MPEPVSVVSAALSIVASTYTLCKTSSEIVSGVKDAPHHISRISDDLQNFYPILRALQVAFEKLKTDWNSLIEETCAVVHRSLQNCVRIFRDLTLLVNKYKSLQPPKLGNAVSYYDSSGKLVVGKWNSIKWDFQKKEVEALTSTLTQCKETCQLAVSTAHFICGQSAANRVQETLQQNNELLKALLAKVINNDQTVRRKSIFFDSDYRPASVIDLYCNSRSERLSDYLADVESTLSSSPISTARNSLATQRVSLDPELRVLRQSFHEILTGEIEQEVNDVIPDPSASCDNVSYTVNADISSPTVLNLATLLDAEDESNIEPHTPMSWLQGYRPEYTPTDFETLCISPLDLFTPRLELEQIYFQPINEDLNVSDLNREILRGHPNLDRATLEWLLAKGENLDAKNKDGWRAMDVAIFVRNLRVAELLYRVGADICLEPKRIKPIPAPLEVALQYKDYNMVIWLITTGVGVNLAGALKNPSRVALINQDLRVVTFMLSQEIRSDSPFHLSGIAKAELLNQINRVPSRSKDLRFSSTILHLLISAQLPFHELPLLPKLGANINTRDHFGQTPVHNFCAPFTDAEASPLILECLLDFNPDLELQDSIGRTALHYAAGGGPAWIFERLVRAGANPHCKDNEGLTPLDLTR